MGLQSFPGWHAAECFYRKPKAGIRDHFRKVKGLVQRHQYRNSQYLFTLHCAFVFICITKFIFVLLKLLNLHLCLCLICAHVHMTKENTLHLCRLGRKMYGKPQGTQARKHLQSTTQRKTSGSYIQEQKQMQCNTNNDWLRNKSKAGTYIHRWLWLDKEQVWDINTTCRPHRETTDWRGQGRADPTRGSKQPHTAGSLSLTRLYMLEWRRLWSSCSVEAGQTVNEPLSLTNRKCQLINNK